MYKIIVGIKCDGHYCNENGEEKYSDETEVNPGCGDLIETEIDLDINYEVKFVDCTSCETSYAIEVDGERKRIVVKKR